MSMPESWIDLGDNFDVHAADSPTDPGLPIYITDSIGSLPALRFRSVGSSAFVRLVADGVPYVSTSGQTVYFIARPAPLSGGGTGTFNAAAQWNQSNTAHQRWEVRRDTTSNRRWWQYQIRTTVGSYAVNTSNNTAVDDASYLVTAIFRDNEIWVRVNGQQSGDRTTMSGSIRDVPTFTPAHHLGIGCRSQAGVSTWSGDISMVYMYDQGHDDSTIEAIEAFFAAKYGIALS